MYRFQYYMSFQASMGESWNISSMYKGRDYCNIKGIKFSSLLTTFYMQRNTEGKVERSKRQKQTLLI